MCLLAATLVGAGRGAEVSYRLWLFWFNYHSEPGMNHVDDNYFSTAYEVGAAAMVIALAAAWMFRGWLWRVAAGGVGALNLALCAAVFFMRQTGMLVTYGEFITVYGYGP